MKNYIQGLQSLTLTAPYAVASGGVFKVGAIVAVAAVAAASGATVEGKVTGVFTLPKLAGQAWIVGDKIYWDDAVKSMTNVAGGTLVGAAVAAALSAATTGTVMLDGTIR